MKCSWVSTDYMPSPTDDLDFKERDVKKDPIPVCKEHFTYSKFISEQVVWHSMIPFE